MLNSERRFRLRLANGQGWSIVSTDGVGSWVEKLASIMQLKTCEPNGDPRLIFIPSVSGETECRGPTAILSSCVREDLPECGWRAQNLRSVTLWFHNKKSDVICKIGHKDHHALDIISMWLALDPIYQRAQEAGGLPLHTALVRWKGMGVLLAAPGGTGKSTCCHRLPSPWQALCDDETLILPVDQKRYVAHPFPTWSDHLWRRSERTWDVQQYLPLSAVFFLEQAGTDDVAPIGQGQAAVFMAESATEKCGLYWRDFNQEEEISVKKKLFDNACELAKAVPAYKLRVSLNGPFWEEMEKVL